MNNIKINEKNRTIEVAKSFSNKASIFGSDEYNMLKAARADFPNFKVVAINSGKKNNSFKGLTIDYMKKYIENHDNEEKEIMKDFCVLCGRNEEWEITELAATATYGEIKSWFLKKYPIFNEYTQKVEKILKSA